MEAYRLIDTTVDDKNGLKITYELDNRVWFDTDRHNTLFHLLRYLGDDYIVKDGTGEIYFNEEHLDSFVEMYENDKMLLELTEDEYGIFVELGNYVRNHFDITLVISNVL